MEPTTFRFKEPHNHFFSTANAMNSSLSNTTYIIKNVSAQKPTTVVTTFSTNKTVFIGKYKKPVTIHHIKDVNASPCQKAACL